MPQKDKFEEFVYKDDEVPQKESKFIFEEFANSNKLQIAGVLVGIILIGFGVVFYKQGYFSPAEEVEVVDAGSEQEQVEKDLFVEISGRVEKPGVYKLPQGARVEDLLISAGGISADADRGWVEKYINRAAKLSDGQKLYIAKIGETDEQSNSSSAKNSGGIKMDQGVLGVGQEGLINVNTASFSELDNLPGIGQVYGQSIIEHRPY